MERVEKSKWMEEMADSVIKEHEKDLGWINDVDAKFAYVISTHQKVTKGCIVYGECRKANPTLKGVAGVDFVITFYAPNMDRFTEQQRRILMYHELLHAKMKDGKAMIENHDYHIEDFKKVIEKYGPDWSDPQ